MFLFFELLTLVVRADAEPSRAENAWLEGVGSARGFGKGNNNDNIHQLAFGDEGAETTRERYDSH